MVERDLDLQVSLRQAEPIPLHVDFSCGRGEMLVMVGPSGSGKTTTLRAIAGLHTPRHGLIRCGARTWYGTEPGINVAVQSRRIGMVFQDYSLFPHLTALDNVAIAVSADNNSARRRAAELLALVNMDGLEQRRPQALSGGQQQRVALARALARDPDVLLLDEPFAAVDQQTRRKLTRELARLRERLSMPIVLVTHDLDEARMLADQISVIHHGRTLQNGPPAEVMSRPAGATVARLVGLENVFAATIAVPDAITGRTRLQWNGCLLETDTRANAAVGSRVDWVIPAESIVLHRRDRPSRGERENPVSGAVAECLLLGEFASLSISLPGLEPLLHLSVPTHVARRNGLERGGPITVSLLAEAIHVMDCEAGDPGATETGQDPWAPD